MTEQTNKPVVSNRDKLLSVSVFPQIVTDDKGESRTLYSMSMQRAYQKPEQKGTKEYERQKISLYPDEALRFAELLRRTYSDLLTYVQMNRSTGTGNSYPAQSMDCDEVQPMPDDSIPF